MEVPLSLNSPKSPHSPAQIQAHDSNYWNSKIKHHTHQKNDRAILTTYTQMEARGIRPDSTTLPLVLKACGRLQAVERGKKIHRDVMGTSLSDDIRVQTALIGFYSRCGLLKDALYVFDEMSERDVVSWNAMISGCVGCCEYEEAFLLFCRMQKENVKLNSVTAVELLVVCGELLELRVGRAIHGYCLRNGLFGSNPHVGTSLMVFYSKFDPFRASLIFESMASRSTVSWNALLSGCTSSGDYLKAVELFLQMLTDGLNCDSVTLLVVIQACAELGSLRLGTQIHQMVVKLGFSGDVYIVNALINMYSKARNVISSCHLFRSSNLVKDVALWNSILSAYVDSGSVEDTISMLKEMQFRGVKMNERTIVIILPVCLELDDGLGNGRSLHAYAIKSDMGKNTHIGNGLLNMYAGVNCVEDAMKIFGEMNEANIFAWNTLIFALARNKLRVQAWELFSQMQELDIKPNSHTIISILAACGNESLLNTGRAIHGYLTKFGIEIDPSLNTALTEMYISCGDEETAGNLFRNFQGKDIISWNSMISWYIENGQVQKPLFILRDMISEIEPNSVTIINVLSLCTHLADLHQGRCLHAYTIRRVSISSASFDSDLSLANTFITMYAKCGSLQYAEKIFSNLPRKNLVSWNSMIAGYGMHGRGCDALESFSQMLKCGFRPNGITFVSALSACSHSGLIKQGLQLFDSMVQKFCIKPELVHYACMVDLLARGGFLNEAKSIIETMPMEPDASVWRALLGASRVYSEAKFARSVSEKLFELEPENAGNYVLLSNIYASAGLWSEVKKIRDLVENKGLKKPPGRSWIVIRSEVHCFAAGDKSHPQCRDVYAKLSSLLSLSKEMGYVPDLRWVLYDEDDERKNIRLSSHSEKLAIAFGLINVRGGSPILITKNLRICGDCHEFSKYVSKLSQREIVIRDASRFHHFVDGLCSCKDYW